MAKVKLGEVAREYKATVKDAVDLPVVGLEHLTPGQVELTQWSEDADNTFTKGFKKGQMLFGRRRAYLKKAALAPFDGICSGDITVIEAIPEKIMPELLPFVIQNDSLFDYAVEKSAGSLSPRVKWEHLKNYEFELPEMEHQRELVDLLWAMTRTKKAYQELEKKTDELVKSQFIERFNGDNFLKEPLKNNVEEMFIGPFGSALKNDCFVDQESGYCMVYEQKHAIQKTMDVPTRYVSERKYQELKRFTVLPGDIIVSCRGTVGEIYAIPDDAPMGIMHPSIMKVRLKKDKYDKKFFVFALEQYMQDHARETNGTSIKMAVSASALEKELFIVPELKEQRQFVSFVEQSDKSKFELTQAISRIDDMIKALMQG